jgi:hypothetical protein
MSEAKKSNAFIKKLIKYAIIFVMAYLIITKIVPLGLKFNMYGTDKFDSKLWNKTSIGKRTGRIIQDWDDYRCSMYNDLTKNHLKKGMKLKEVTDMLGDYRSVDYCTNKKVKCISYTLGSCLKGIFNKSLIVEFFGHYDRQFMYVCFDGNEEFISSGKSYGKKKYSYSVCEGENNTILCGKYSGDCTRAPRMGGKDNDEVIYDEVDFEQW